MTYNISSDPFYNEWYFKQPLGSSVLEDPYFKGFEFEKIDIVGWTDYMVENWKLAFYVGAAYIATIFGLQRYMKNRPAFELKYPLFIWNLVLGVMSGFGFIRVLPAFLTVLSEPNGLYNSICVKKGLDIPSGYWAILFALSKFVELGDTLFIVLRKRPLIFLQWYHHLATLIVVWLTGIILWKAMTELSPLVEPIVRWYAVLNAVVHSLMYPYFALRAIGVKIPSYVANFITTVQFSQMLIGFGVNMTSWYLQHNYNNCQRYPLSIMVFCGIYFTFILLFGKLFVDSVIKGGKKRSEKSKQS